MPLGPGGESADRRVGRPQLSMFAKRVFVNLGMVALARALPTARRSATILRYHSVSASGDFCSPTIAVSPGMFETQMRFLARNYNVFTLDELLTRFENGGLPRNSVAITFDDGYLDNATEALPALVRHGLPATFFVTSDSVLGKGCFWVGWLYRATARAAEATLRRACLEMTGSAPRSGDRQSAFASLASLIDTAESDVRPGYLREIERHFPDMPPLAAPSDFMMSLRDLQKLQEAGMTIGAHTATHRVLAGVRADEAREELVRSKTQLEAALGVSVDHLAYPNGHVRQNVDAAAVRLATEAGYRSAGTSRRGTLMPGARLMDLPRQGVNAALGMEGFVFKLEEARFPLLLRA